MEQFLPIVGISLLVFIVYLVAEEVINHLFGKK